MPLSVLGPVETAPAPAEQPPSIRAEGLSVILGSGTKRQEILREVDLSVPEGSFVCLIGPSGCGKSTLLKALGGLVRPSAGRVTIRDLPPRAAARRRMIGLVFQDANLLPWKSALDNVALLRFVADKSLSHGKARELARAMLDLVGLGGAVDKMPAQLSGGMRQRVAIARALALDPAVLLMDEPFGALDAITREAMSEALLDIWRRTRKTIVFVTHSIDEAIFLGSRVYVLGTGPGRIVERFDLPPADRRGETDLDPADLVAIGRRMRAALRPQVPREETRP